MKKLFIAAALVLILLLSACQAAAPAADSNQTAPQATDYPAAQQAQPADSGSYPAQQNAEPGSAGAAYPAQDGDANMLRGEFMLDQAQLTANGANPAMTDVWVQGNLPTSCNMMRSNVPGPDSSNVINVELYSVSEKDQVCAQSLAPFSGVVATLGGYPAGKYTVNINGQKVGEFEVK